jgi:hypothetical protein
MAARGRIAPGENPLEVFGVFARIVFLVFFGKGPGMSAAIPLAAKVPPFFLAQSFTILGIVVRARPMCR